jgi:hypothetical protein
MDRIIRETTEIELHPYKMNREGGFSLRRSRKLLIHDMKERRQAVTKNTTPSSGP